MINLYQNPILEQIYGLATHPAYAQKMAIQSTDGKSITYNELKNQVEALAVGLVEGGFQPGDRVLLLLRPTLDLMLIIFAVVRAGGVLVIADPAMGQALFADRIALAKPQWVFTESLFLLVQKIGILRMLLKQRGVELPELQSMQIQHTINVGRMPFLAPKTLHDLKQSTIASPIRELARVPQDDMTIVFTSGTTGKPKGVVHSIESMLATLERIRHYAQITPDDVIYDTGTLLLIPALMCGASAILGVGNFDAHKTIHAYRRYGITKTIDIPANIKKIVHYLAESGQKFPASLRDLMLGAAPVLPDFLQLLQGYVEPTTRIFSVYGMTELLPVSFVSVEEKLTFDSSNGDLVGKPLEGITAELAKDGELLLSGAGLYSRYLGDLPVQKHPTGDLARLDSEGRIILLGRKKDMIIRGHYNIYPSLFEPIIRQIEGVEDAALVGVYNARQADEEIVLFVQPKAGVQDLERLKGEIQSQLLTGVHSIDVYAQPQHIFFHPIPYSGRSQKSDKKALRALAQKLLGL